MKINLPVTQIEIPFPQGKYLVSKTDLKGTITYANDAFIDISGFSRDELLGKNHNLVRHPDMPPQAFEDLWRTVKSGQPWRGLVKNRAKDGAFYWVEAFVVPLHKNGVPTGYMSVRSVPARAEISAAEVLYRQLKDGKGKLHSGGGWLKSLTLQARMLAAIAAVALLLIGGAYVGISGQQSANAALGQVYQHKLQPTVSMSQMMELVADNRAQLMLALQHDPANPLVKLHDHSIDKHYEAFAANREGIAKLLEEIKSHDLTPEERALVVKFVEARDRYRKEGADPMIAALKAGDFMTAQTVLLKQVNPLTKEFSAAGQKLSAELVASAQHDYEAANKRYNTMFVLSVVGSLVSIMVILIGGMLLMRSVVNPIKRAVCLFDSISKGNLTNEVPIGGRDETGQMLSGLAAMQVHLKVMLDEISSNSQVIQERSLQLQKGMTLVVKQSQEQHDRVQSTAAATEEFSQSVVDVAESAQNAAKAAIHSQQLVHDSNASISNSMDATGRVVQAVQDSSGTIGALNVSIEKIGAITQVIKEIADQTNLLALNAAIEAARAGEAGRGFAVVADEVRKLAERTTASTADISGMVTEIQNATHQAVGSMEQAVREVEEGTGMMRESVSGLALITEASGDVSVQAQHIADAAREQAVASEQVASNMDQISSLIERNTASAHEAWEATENLSHAAHSLKELVSHFELTKR
jgi:aerotaxis receptor